MERIQNNYANFLTNLMLKIMIALKRGQGLAPGEEYTLIDAIQDLAQDVSDSERGVKHSKIHPIRHFFKKYFG
jgi:hypothetical protein